MFKTVPVPEQGLVAKIQQKFSQLKECGQGIQAIGRLIEFVIGIGREVVDANGDVRSVITCTGRQRVFLKFEHFCRLTSKF